MTIRDEVWNEVITTLATEGEFRIKDLDIDEEKKYTVRRCLQEMEDQGWVTRSSKQSPIYRTGWKMKLIMNQTSDEEDVEIEPPEE